MPLLTRKQKNVLDYISQYAVKHQFAPSLEEIRKHFKLASVSTAHHYVDKLKKGGYLNKESGQPRSIEVLSNVFLQSLGLPDQSYDSISVPVLGAANCGPANIFAEERIEAYLKVPSVKAQNKKHL